MKIVAIDSLIFQGGHSIRSVIRLCLLFSVIGSACGASPPTEAPTLPAVPTSAPSIETGGPCEVAVGKTMPLAVKGISGTGVTYRWSATAGNVNPPDGPAVNYIAPDTPGDVIIRVEVEKDGVTSDATISCKVIGPEPAVIPTLEPSPVPTPWECTSFRPEKLQSADIPGEVTIDTPAQATIDLPAGQNIQAGGSYSGVPEGKHLWVFIYSASAGLHGRYYPQTRDAKAGWQPDKTVESGGRWSLPINFGAPSLCYEVIVMAAEPAASQSIVEQLKKWDVAGEYTGYELNGPASADPPAAPGFPSGLVEKASIEVKTK